MLRKRTRSVQKDQYMGHLPMSDIGSDSSFHFDVMGQRHRKNPIFSVSGVFVGQNPKGLSDCDSVRSPTSPLDFRVFSNLGNPFRSQKSWDCDKVGLSIIDSLDNTTKISGEVKQLSNSKNIVFGPQMRSKTPNFCSHIDSFEASKSLPKNYAIFPHIQIKSSNLQTGNSGSLFEIGEAPLEPEPFGVFRSCSLDSGHSFLPLTSIRKSNLSSGDSSLINGTTQVNAPPESIGGILKTGIFSQIHKGSDREPIESLSASEIELSEDYTCVITHGPNPKTTHIYGDCILGCHSNDLANSTKREEQEFVLPHMIKCTEISAPFPSDNFLSFCYSCKKKLEGKDIYMYRGEKAFCSLSCRETEIMVDDEMEETPNDSSENSPAY